MPGKVILLLLCQPARAGTRVKVPASHTVQFGSGRRGGNQRSIMGNANPFSFLLLLFVWRWLKTEKWGRLDTEFSTCWAGTVWYQDTPGVPAPKGLLMRLDFNPVIQQRQSIQVFCVLAMVQVRHKAGCWGSSPWPALVIIFLQNGPQHGAASWALSALSAPLAIRPIPLLYGISYCSFPCGSSKEAPWSLWPRNNVTKLY